MFMKGDTWPVLDKGYIKLINWMGDDEEIVEAARMSTGRGFVSWQPYKRCPKCETVYQPSKARCEDCRIEELLEFDRGDMGFLEFMYSSRHMTPFEMPELCIEVQAPLFVFREWHRHRTQSYNEFSARYAQMPNLHYIPALERIVKQSKKHKQAGSDERFPKDDALAFMAQMDAEQQQIYLNYDNFIKAGIANEISRVNTPVSRYSKMRAKTDLRNWLSFLILRKQSSHSKPQWEIAQYADIVGIIIQGLFPRTYALFEEYTLYAETFSRTELKLLRKMLQIAQLPVEDLAREKLGKRAEGFLAKLRESA